MFAAVMSTPNPLDLDFELPCLRRERVGVVGLFVSPFCDCRAGEMRTSTSTLSMLGMPRLRFDLGLPLATPFRLMFEPDLRAGLC